MIIGGDDAKVGNLAICEAEEVVGHVARFVEKIIYGAIVVLRVIGISPLVLETVGISLIWIVSKS
jgi:hypothetical protein